MRVGILGSGDVAKSFGRGFLKEGNEVMLGSREPEKMTSWLRDGGQNSSSGTLAETAKFGELLVIAVNGAKAVEAIQMAGVDGFQGKVVVRIFAQLYRCSRARNYISSMRQWEILTS